MKYVILTTMFIAFLFNKKNNIELQTLFIYIVLVFILFCSFFHFVMSDNFYFESFILLQSIVLSILIFFVLTSSFKNNVIKYEVLSKYVIIGILLYSIFKFSLSIAIFFGVLSVDSLQYISPDFTSLGYIGVTGFNRIVGVNDFLLPFLYFFIKDSSIKHKKIVASIFIFSIFISFTRSIWFSFFFFFFLEQVFIRKKPYILFLLVIILVVIIYYFSFFTTIDLLGSIQSRLFNEGALSSSVKIEQAGLMLEQISKAPFFGGGLGSYIPDYIRNDRLKYGYEVMLLALVMQNGLFFTFLILIILGAALYKAYIINGDGFSLFSLTLFVSAGFTNPIIISSVSVYLYALYAIKFMSK
ncbi:hypothetical protein EHN07_10060 [Buttiauxella warmboldiae]|uniref:O-antigen ligase domain-containing protein n=1 Tax=Buttiauxella warmboldiae TaxID=82993 RepID=A0A3N5EBG9_9ENTR|nr:hypothetical protein [Buttiauxella warmboldiae]RPH28132.1 hypothetical protein EHN07_10060 [Buttiauxella warmboldiae]